MIPQVFVSMFKRSAALAALLVCGAAFGSAALEAQTVSYSYGETLVRSGSESTLLATDSQNNVFVFDNASQTLIRIAPDGTQTTLSGIINEPVGLALDAAGNAYVTAGASTNKVFKFSPSGVESTININPGGTPPGALAIDKSGNIYMAAVDGIVEFDQNGNVFNPIVPYFYTIGLGFTPTSLAVDPTGNIFAVNKKGNQVVEISPSGVQTTIATGLNSPGGLALDAAGDLFIADEFNNRVVEVPAGGGSQVDLLTGLYRPLALATTSTGDLIVGDGVDFNTEELGVYGLNARSANVCPAGQQSPAPCSQSSTLIFNIYQPVTLGTPQVLIQGAPNLDFTLAAGSTCTGAVAAGSTCSVNVTFAPTAAGVRNGAVQIVDNNGNALATTFIHGVGVGPQIAYDSAAPVTLANGFGLVEGLAVDGSGNLYAADTDKKGLVKIAPGGAQTPVGTGVSQPNAVAVDAAGNVFAVENSQTLVEVTPAGVQTTIASNLPISNALAVDGNGNLYAAQYPGLFQGTVSPIVEISPAGVKKNLGSDPSGNVTSVAVDASGDVFFGDDINHTVFKIAPDGTQTTVATNIQYPTALAVDAAGNLIVVESASGSVLQISPAGVQTTLASGFLNLSAGALDTAGDLFLVDQNGTTLDELPRSEAPTLAFAATGIGTTSSDSPQSVQVENIGNVSLNFTALSVAANFAQVDGTGTPADCSASSQLAPGAACNLSLSFTPTGAGTIAGSVVLTDNALNATPATQSIALNGSGTLATQTITFTGLPANAAYGSAGPYMLAATASSGLAVSYSVSGPATLSGSTLTITGVGKVVVTASQAGNSDYSAATPVSQTIVIGAASQSITFPAIAAQTVGASLNLSATATSGLAVTFASTTPSVCSVSGTMANMLAAGTCTLQATQAGNASYAAATPVSVSFSVAAATTGSFKLITTPNSETIRRGDLAAFLLEAQSVNKFSGAVKITCSGGPAASVCGSFPQTLTLQPNGVAVAISGILFPANTTPGTYTLTFTGTSGTTIVSTTAQFKVQN